MVKYTINDVKTLIEPHGGEYIDFDENESIFLKTRFSWKCSKGHIWQSAFASIKNGHWCHSCRTRKKTIKDMKDYAEAKGGKCLSKVYINNSKKLWWQCQCGYKWEAVVTNVFYKGKWCPRCAKNAKKSIQDAHKLASIRNGKCISKEYKNSGSLMEWQCEYGHVWKSTYNNISNGHWCGQCSSFTCEKICRYVMEQVFEVPFNKQRIKTMLSPKGFPLEFDGYNKKIRIAFEYNGAQHYIVDGKYNKNDYNLFNRLEYDKIKETWASHNNVKLFKISYYDDRFNLYKEIQGIKEQIAFDCCRYGWQDLCNKALEVEVDMGKI